MKSRFSVMTVSSLSALLLASASPVMAQQSNGAAYYTTDIDKAVRHADRRPSNVYVGNRWYNRTTSKSFDLPKLLNREMSTERLEGALDSTAAGNGPAPERLSPEQLSEINTPLKKDTDKNIDEIITSEIKETSVIANGNNVNLVIENGFDTNIEYIDYSVESYGYNGSAHNISAQGTLSAEARP